MSKDETVHKDSFKPNTWLVYFAREWRVQGCLRSGEDKLGNAWFRFNRHDEEKKNLICGPRLPVAT